MVTLDLKSVFIGLMIGFCTITLIASENEENIVENSVGRYRIFESNNNPERIMQVHGNIPRYDNTTSSNPKSFR